MAQAFADWIGLNVRGRKLIAEAPGHGRPLHRATMDQEP